ncbi:hypothetical protein A2363_04345 [Candidatus Gottesmanbacteria bacterium RIFOXYB1_FULL_47_11]|uniref:Uncharacterized protein n=1 Tax=Candidatus Gottesmanbacteria bacterium RIFOXYB1_FULL_47_11 TaxID=1798401 RepID=A0A1F6BFW4_9BACT|nr:MAG: hypothetical protein A2363_04345 [Candidatus Gottesmanbacteria bacterium RIFOXYB1_FULL_47_11]
MHQPDKYRELFQNAATNKLIGVEQVQGFPEEELKFIKTIERLFGDTFRANQTGKMGATELGRLVKEGGRTMEVWGVAENGKRVIVVTDSGGAKDAMYGVVINRDSTVSYAGKIVEDGETSSFGPVSGEQAAKILYELNALPWHQMQTKNNPLLAKKL